MRALAIFFGLWASLNLTTTQPASAGPAKGLRFVHYTVKDGDNLYDLARKFGCSESELARHNQLGAILPVGKKLLIPTCGKSALGQARLEQSPRRPSEPSRTAKRAPSTLSRPGAPSRPGTPTRPGTPSTSARLAAKLAPPPSKELPAAPRQSSTERTRAATTPRRAIAEPKREAPRREAPAELIAQPAEPAVLEGPITTPYADPVTGSITRVTPDAAAAPATAAAPAELARVTSRKLRPDLSGSLGNAIVGSAPDIAGTIGRAPAAARLGRAPAAAQLPAALLPDHPVLDEEELSEADGPSDHKLVLDGRKARPGPRLGALDLLDQELPPAGQSIGLPWRGRLQSAARLGYGEGYVLRRPHRTYGTRTTVAHVESVLAELRQKFPKLHTLAIGDLSQERGGRISEHRSHQSGRDIDIGLCFYEAPKTYPEHFVVATEATLDPEATWALIAALVDTEELDGGLAMIFLDFQVQGIVYRWAVAQGIDQQRLEHIFQYPHGRGAGAGLVRHARNHADHIHARFRCADDEAGCR